MPLTVSVRANGPNDSRYMLGFNAYLDRTTPYFASNGPGAMLNWGAAYADICLGVAPAGLAGQQALIPMTLSLGEVADFIAQNDHLPGVPAAAEVAHNGVNVGETQALLLEKIEKMTLHLIRLEKENECLKADIEQLKR
ncbi:MAG TPA: hypothetical protein ENJ82_12810 [Bacteroidetes bacterium]|nr:hypothetical protein [Bacteroidota bacterium]